ncbi:calpain-like cysteine peptidase [Trypanosoma grayi]|uniref:calpain-like cysteine peptidase n=1 Tax=Trypanosoma grayi TaxID=71804 RepID=UPI0004F45E14|nr:calpain-like cysteine peptidase [Trypanosoma grayi]KEG09949.1 calpain-like cysteine peptidase [Trypanosoma grayi]
MVDGIRELKKDPKRNAETIEGLRDRMNDRAHEIAQEKLKNDRGFLDKDPEGVPLSILPLDEDRQFHELEVRRAALKAKDSGRNSTAVRDVEAQLNDRAHELANDQKKEELKGIDEAPEGIPIHVLQPHDDPRFGSMVNELRRLKKHPNEGDTGVGDLLRQMNDRAHELAADRLQGDRGYLEKDPLGVPLELLPLSSDADFHGMEVQRAVLKAQDPRRNAGEIADLEKRLNERAVQLAEDQRQRDLEGLDKEPESIPLSVLDPHSDKGFAKLVDQLRGLQDDPQACDEIAALKCEMNELAHALAKQRKEGDRGYLDKEPQGVPLEVLPLNTDPSFRQMEAERAKLKAQSPRHNAKKIKELEDALNNRAHELARDQLREDLKGVDEQPRGIPLEVLRPHDDPSFSALVNDIRRLKEDPEANANAVADVLGAMSDRVQELAAAQLDRDFLDPNPEGVPLEVLPLDTDPEFHAMETERVKLKLSDPRRNAKKIKGLEVEMNARAHDLARQQLQDDLSGVDAAPKGIPLPLLKVTEDAEFAAFVPQLRELKKNPEGNAEAIRNVEKMMNNKAYELADGLLEGDRGYLDPAPLGVALSELPLNADDAFSRMEVERAKLKAQDPRRNAAKVVDLEAKLNGRALDLAKAQLAEDLRGFPSQYEGIDTAQLRPHDDKEFALMVPELRRMKKEGQSEALRAHTAEMDRRLGEIAKELVDGDLWFLDKEPEGVLLEHVPLEQDAVFEQLRRERAQLKAEDPRASAALIKDKEAAMNERVHELARQVKDEDFSGLEKEPHGIPLNLLPLREDPVAAKLILLSREERRRGDKSPSCGRLREIQEELNARAQELAKEALAGDREKYLDRVPEGVPVEVLPLDTDPRFHALEVECAKLKLEDPQGNAERIEQLEEELNERAHELAREQLQEDLSGLERAPCGVPMEVLNPHKDAEFNRAAEHLRELKRDPRRNDAKIKELKAKMGGRARELARAMLDEGREFLDPMPEGVPLADLPLDKDPTFHTKEVERVTLRVNDPVKNAAEITALEEELNRRLHELAKDQLQEDLKGLEGAPRGVPMALLRPHDDAAFASLVPGLRQLKKDPKRNADDILATEGKMDACADELAEDFLRTDREAYLDLAPLGVPLNTLPLDTDPQFKAKETERLQLMLNPKDNEEAIAELEGVLNARAFQLAEEKLKNDRGFLDKDPEGVPLSILPLDEDRQFHELEVRRAALKAKDPVRNAAAIRDLEDELNDRAHELAKEQLAEDVRGVDPAPHGIPIAMLKPHSDPEFREMVDALRQLKADANADPAAISALEADMNDRALKLAEEALHRSREKLDRNPEGVPLEALPLDEDKALRQIEVEMAKLRLAGQGKNGPRIADLEEMYNDRVGELARERKSKDLEGLEQCPQGIPLALLNPHDDSVFASLVNGARCGADGSRELPAGGALDALNERANALAEEVLKGDRGYLVREPEGIPLSALPLDSDPEFHSMEVERAVLKLTDPRKNADKIADLEERLNDRARELAREQLGGDRGYLDPDPEGVPIADLSLDEDPKFHQMEVERAKLKARDPVSNAYRIRELEEKLNDRAHELANKKLEEDLDGMDREPEGVPLALLQPHEDAEFVSFLPELRRLKKDPLRNAAKIKGLQSKLNDRVHELAKEAIAEGRKFLDPEPEGVPLELLPLDTDKKFSTLEKELRALQAAPRRNETAIENLMGRLNERAHELAREKIHGDRGFLDPVPEGVALADIPLDSDPKFRSIEAERAKLREDPENNASAIAKLESELNGLAHELAKEVKKANRSFLNPTSHGIPKELLPLDEDRGFQAMEQQLRKLMRDRGRNAAAIENLQDMMQDRADELGLQMLKGDRDTYLDPFPESVDIADVAVDDDAEFGKLELERAILKAEDPLQNKDRVAELEEKLNERLHELAKERIKKDRAFLDTEPEGIPLEDVPLDSDVEFGRLEAHLRKLSREPRRNGPTIADLKERMNDRAHELAKEIVADDLKCLSDKYRGIPKEELNLHKDNAFKELANKRRRARTRGSTPVEITALEDAMDARACEIADDVINNERAFLDPEPEGMCLADVPLDTDETFLALEAERRKRMKDPRSAKRNKDIIRDLEDNMNDRAAALAKAEFAKMRDFMDQEPEGVPLAELQLDMDPEFKEAEVARYKLLKDPNHSVDEVAVLEAAMNDRAHELARAVLAKDRRFLDPEPEGVPLEELPLDTDQEFNELAMERRQLMKDGKKCKNPEVKAIEGKMNDRVHELAKDYLKKNRAFLNPEPEGVPLEDVPIGRDPVFLDTERELAKAQKDPKATAEKIRRLQEELDNRAHDVAKELLRKERAFLDPEPFGVPLAELPLNHDPILNPLERDRRALKKDPKRNADAIRNLEDEIQDRVREIVKEFVEKERAFLDPEPEGVPLCQLPLDTDRQFRDMEHELRALKKQPAKNKDMIGELQEEMNNRAHELAKDYLQKNRAFLDPEPLGVPLSELPLGDDPEFHDMEARHRELKKNPTVNVLPLKELEDEMNERAKELAREFLRKERAFLDQEPEGIPLSDLPLHRDKHFREMEKKLRELKKSPRKNAEEIKDLEYDMNDRVHELARRQLSDDRHYLPLELCGVLLGDLRLDEDPEFRELELQRRNLKRDPKKNAEAIREVEDKLTDRAFMIAEEFLRKDREYLDPEPEGILLDRVPLNDDRQFREMEQERRRLMKDPKNKAAVCELEERLNQRAHELAQSLVGWQDPEFHEANKHVAEEWPRICELYPEGIREDVVPERTLPSDVCSAPDCAGCLAPFIAALSRHPVLIERLFESKTHPVNTPYVFTFFDPNSKPVRIEIDDRVPVNVHMEPKFTQVPHRSWYPLLLEKAYAKFVGGYARLDQCTPHETLRDLTGRPVLHIPFDDKLAEAANTGDYKTVGFWIGVSKELERGDVITCMSNLESEDGIHPQCSYALMGVIHTVKESNDPSDIVIKLHNCYYDEPLYTGPLNQQDPNWTEELKRICRFDAEENDVLYLPLPTFLRNFSSMQRCHINCGDRLSSPGEWNEFTCGGNPKFTTFRNNPIYLVENKSSRPVPIVAELRHHAPAFSDPDGLNHYHQTGLVLMQAVQAKMPVSPLITNGTHRFIQKGMMLDAREVCSQMELPPNTTCYLIPYTIRPGCYGKFSISVYPGMAKVTLTPMRGAGLKREPLTTEVTLKPGSEGSRGADFHVSDPCDVHVLLRQLKFDDEMMRHGDCLADSEVKMLVFDEHGIRVATTGDATNAREQALVFRASKGGFYSIVAVCMECASVSGCPCVLQIFTPKNVVARIASAPLAVPLRIGVALPSITTTPTRSSRARTDAVERGSQRSISVGLPKISLTPSKPVVRSAGGRTQWN